jgi:hypothetical protein
LWHETDEAFIFDPNNPRSRLHVLKVTAIGDVHADFGRLWAALKAAGIMDSDGHPTGPVLDGQYRAILIGDLVHPKNIQTYEKLTGREPFDWKNPEHLRSAARAQVRELQRLRHFVEACEGGVTILMGNHDASALNHKHVLGTATGLKHAEFDESLGGVRLPDDLADWMRKWLPEVRLHGVHFSHAGPTPGMASFDDFFYADRDAKHWWHERPYFVHDAGHKFGVYGHTVMPDGIHINEEHGFAMIDALEKRQYLDMLFHDDGEFDYRVTSF